MGHNTSYGGVRTRRTTFTTIILFMVITNFSSTESGPLMNTVCETKECERAAVEISAKMDTNVGPCDNFYQFVCGNYVKDDSTMPTQMETFKQMRSNAAVMRASLLAEKRHETGPKPFRHVAKLYQLCMDQNTRIREGVKPLRDMLQKLGGWPLLEGDEWNDINNDWLQIDRNLLRNGYNLNLFLRLGITKPPGSNNREFWVNAPNIAHSLPKDLVEKAVKLGAERHSAERAIAGLYQFEKDFTNIIVRTRRGSLEEFNLEELLTRWPTVSWENFFNSVLVYSSAVPIDATEKIYVNSLFVDEFVAFISRQTSSRLLTNYALSRVVDQSWIYIRDDDIVHSSLDQSQLCLDIIYMHTPVSLDAMYAVNSTESDKRSEVVSMMAAMKTALIEDLNQAEFLDEESRNRIVEKLATLHTMIGYRDEWKSKKWLEELHADLELNSNNFLCCILDIAQFKNRYHIRSGRFHIEDQAHLVVRDKIPSYGHLRNTLTIPAFSIQNPLFNIHLPKYMNYGRIGAIMGHEIVHSMQVGKSYADEIYSEESLRKLTEKMNCFINQYNNYVFGRTSKSVNGTATLNENISDNIGVELAYSAYIKAISRSSVEPALPNLQYTPKKMFWISWASKACIRIDLKRIKNNASTMRYTPLEFRINGAATNSVHFSEDFGCPAGSPMNPVKKCNILH